jgi:UTP--glucose-1-phosphate uridylyltransferase
MKTLAQSQDFFGMKYEGRTHDTGSKLGFLVANAAYALESDELAGPFRRELEALLKG